MVDNDTATLDEQADSSAPDGDEAKGASSRTSPATLADRIAIGMGHCRRKEWHSALEYLAPLKSMRPEEHRSLPASAWSSLGLAVARGERDYPEAVKLCAKALHVAPKEADNHLNLAWCLLIARRRSDAATALLKGRELSPRHAGLLDLHQKLGIRQPPVVPFLARGNRLNRWLGRRRFERACDSAAEDHFLLDRFDSRQASRVAPLLAILVLVGSATAAMYLPGRTSLATLRVGDVVYQEQKKFGTIKAFDEARPLLDGDPKPSFQIKLADGSGTIWMSKKAARKALSVKD